MRLGRAVPRSDQLYWPLGRSFSCSSLYAPNAHFHFSEAKAFLACIFTIHGPTRFALGAATIIRQLKNNGSRCAPSLIQGSRSEGMGFQPEIKLFDTNSPEWSGKIFRQIGVVPEDTSLMRRPGLRPNFSKSVIVLGWIACPYSALYCW